MSNEPPSNHLPPPTPEFNPVTIARFRRQSWWQITFPVVGTVALLVAGLVLLIVLGGPPAVAVVADYSLSLLLILGLVGGLLILVLFAGLVYLLAKLLRGTPAYTYKVHRALDSVYRWVDTQTSRIAGAVIAFKSLMAGLEVYLKQQGAASDSPPASAPDDKPASQGD